MEKKTKNKIIIEGGRRYEVVLDTPGRRKRIDLGPALPDPKTKTKKGGRR